MLHESIVAAPNGRRTSLYRYMIVTGVRSKPERVMLSIANYKIWIQFIGLRQFLQRGAIAILELSDDTFQFLKTIFRGRVCHPPSPDVTRSINVPIPHTISSKTMVPARAL